MKCFLILFLFYTSSVSGNFSKNIFLVFIGDDYKDTKILTSTDDYRSLIGSKYYNASRPTVLFTFGYLCSFSGVMPRTMIDAYLLRGDHNIIAIDWTAYSKNVNYLEIVTQLNEVENLF